MKSLISLLILLEVYHNGRAEAGSDSTSGGLNLQLGGLALNQEGLKISNSPPIAPLGGEKLGFTVVPSIKEVLEHHERTPIPGTEQSSKKDRLPNISQRKKSYLDRIEDELEKERPSINEINERRHEAGYAHVTGEEEDADANCPVGDEACEHELMMWAASPADKLLSVKEKLLNRAKRDKKYEWAIKKGTGKAGEELKKQGGADPYGGLLIPNLMDQAKNTTTSPEAKEALAEGKGTKTLKGSKKGGKSDEPDAATSPTA